MRIKISKQKENKLKNDYNFLFQDTLENGIKENTRAINHLKEVKKKSSTTQVEKNAISKVQDLLENTIYVKKVLIKEKKDKTIDDDRKLNEALKEVNAFLAKKNLTDKEKLILWARVGSYRVFYGILYHKAIEEHYKENVPYYLVDKILTGTKLKDAYSTLLERKISITYQGFIDDAINEFFQDEK